MQKSLIPLQFYVDEEAGIILPYRTRLDQKSLHCTHVQASPKTTWGVGMQDS